MNSAHFRASKNIVNLDNPTTTLTSATFGQIRTARAMRQMQLGIRYSF